MQTFKCSVTDEVYQYENDVMVACIDGVYLFATASGVPLNAPTTLQPYTIPAKTEAEIAAEEKQRITALLTNAVQNRLDEIARLKGYDNSVSASSYAAVVNPFQAESQVYVAWRANCWATCYTIMGEVEAGTRAIPTVDELLAALPTSPW